jgi:hypothetical protein
MSLGFVYSTAEQTEQTERSRESPGGTASAVRPPQARQKAGARAAGGGSGSSAAAREAAGRVRAAAGGGGGDGGGSAAAPEAAERAAASGLAPPNWDGRGPRVHDLGAALGAKAHAAGGGAAGGAVARRPSAARHACAASPRHQRCAADILLGGTRLRSALWKRRKLDQLAVPLTSSFSHLPWKPRRAFPRHEVRLAPIQTN